MYRIYKYVSHGGNAVRVKDFRSIETGKVSGERKEKTFKFGGPL